jgi:hypothetical protein
MSNIRIVTDSTADLTPELVNRYGIKVVPLEVLADGKAYKDKIDITNDEYYEILRTAKTLPTTSQPSPAVFADTYQALAAEGAEHIISIQISSELSGTYQSSVLAASLVADTVTVHNFDSRTATMGLGLIVLSAARMVEEGRSLEVVHHFGHGSGLLGGVDIGKHGNIAALTHFSKYGEAFLHAHAAEAGAGGAVGLVEAGLVEEGDARFRKNLLERGGNFQRMGAAFHGARASDEKEGGIIIGLDVGLAVEIYAEHGRTLREGRKRKNFG